MGLKSSLRVSSQGSKGFSSFGGFSSLGGLISRGGGVGAATCRDGWDEPCAALFAPGFGSYPFSTSHLPMGIDRPPACHKAWISHQPCNPSLQTQFPRTVSSVGFLSLRVSNKMLIWSTVQHAFQPSSHMHHCNAPKGDLVVC